MEPIVRFVQTNENATPTIGDSAALHDELDTIRNLNWLSIKTPPPQLYPNIPKHTKVYPNIPKHTYGCVYLGMVTYVYVSIPRSYVWVCLGMFGYVCVSPDRMFGYVWVCLRMFPYQNP